MACSVEDQNESVEPQSRSKEKSSPQILISSISGIKKCVGGVKKYGAEFTVNSTTFDYYYDQGGGTSFDGLDIQFFTSSEVPIESPHDDKYACDSDRNNRSTIRNFTTCSGTSGVVTLSANTTYKLKLIRVADTWESDFYEFTTPAAGSQPCSLD